MDTSPAGSHSSGVASPLPTFGILVYDALVVSASSFPPHSSFLLHLQKYGRLSFDEGAKAIQ